MSHFNKSKSTKKVGERDLLIQNNTSKVPEAVLEGFILHSNSKDVIKGHYKKLIKKYDVYGNKKNYMLVYCKVKDFDGLWKKYTKHFDSFTEIKTEKGNIHIGSSKEKQMEIIHYFMNFHSIREEI